MTEIQVKTIERQVEELNKLSEEMDQITSECKGLTKTLEGFGIKQKDWTRITAQQFPGVLKRQKSLSQHHTIDFIGSGLHNKVNDPLKQVIDFYGKRIALYNERIEENKNLRQYFDNWVKSKLLFIFCKSIKTNYFKLHEKALNEREAL